MPKVYYLCCPFCGMTKPLQNIRLESFGKFDISWKTLHVREQHPRERGGGSLGFTLIPDECLSIVEMARRSEYRGYVEGIKLRLLKILRVYVQAGLISAEELGG